MCSSIYLCPLTVLLVAAVVAPQANANSLLDRSTGSGSPALPNSKPICYRHPNPMKPTLREVVECDVVEVKSTAGNRLINAVGSGRFVLNFVCPAGAATCQKAQDTFAQAFEILEGNLILNQDVIVNASFVDFCAVMSQCRSDGFQVLGGAAPERSVVLEDNDGIRRAYPQALVKQLNLPQRPRYSGSDIFAQFNAAAKFAFPSDPQPMASGQSDFLFVVLHELIHGLGFTSSWDDYFNEVPSALTPGISGSTTRAGFLFDGFIENAFDRFVVETSTGSPISARTAALNRVFPGGSNTFPNIQAFSNALQASEAFKANAVQMFRLATVPQSLAFVTSGNLRMLLETSLPTYQPGSSVSHGDLKTFSDTADFLMRFRVDPGMSLSDAVQKGKGGPLGPILLGVLESLGYATKANPNPLIRVKSAGSSATGSSAQVLVVTSIVTVLTAFVPLFS